MGTIIALASIYTKLSSVLEMFYEVGNCLRHNLSLNCLNWWLKQFKLSVHHPATIGRGWVGRMREASSRLIPLRPPIARSPRTEMATSVLRSKMENSLHISGDDRTRKARESGEDIAILSTFLPPSLVGKTSSSLRPFECALGEECRLGDVKLAKPGQSMSIFLAASTISNR